MALVELLPHRLPDVWPAGDVDTRHRPVATRLPGALGARDLAVLVQLGRRLAEVPHVAVLVLCVPVRRPLVEPTREEEPVVQGDAANALDQLRLMRHRQ